LTLATLMQFIRGHLWGAGAP